MARQGEYQDDTSNTGLHYNLNRYYDPGLGRYLTQDPIKLIGGENFYHYCPNPVSWIDPLGFKGLPGGASNTAKVPEGVPLSSQKVNEIQNIPKGERPDPNTYLPQSYIDTHLAQFEKGSSRVITRDSYETYGIGKPDVGKTEFVSTNQDIDKILHSSNGDLGKIAESLGIPANQLSEGGGLVRIDFKATSNYKPTIPSGNEFGTNSQWIPGGKLPTGSSEAVVKTENMVKGVDYTVTDLGTGKLL